MLLEFSHSWEEVSSSSLELLFSAPIPNLAVSNFVEEGEWLPLSEVFEIFLFLPPQLGTVGSGSFFSLLSSFAHKAETDREDR